MIDLDDRGKEGRKEALSNLSVVYRFWSWSLSPLGFSLSSRSLPRTSEIGAAQGPHLLSSSMFVLLRVAFTFGVLVTISVLRLRHSWDALGFVVTVYCVNGSSSFLKGFSSMYIVV